MSGEDAQPTKSRSVQNEPNLVRPGRLMEGIVQNKAKLGQTGACGQRSSCGPWLGRLVKRAKRTQFGPARRRAGGEMCKTNPILLSGQMVGTAHPTKRGGSLRRGIVQNEPNFARQRTRAGGEMRKTNPISLPGRWWAQPALPGERERGHFEYFQKNTCSASLHMLNYFV
jgi:hypothetical protein